MRINQESIIYYFQKCRLLFSAAYRRPVKPLSTKKISCIRTCASAWICCAPVTGKGFFLEACLQTRQRFVVDNTNPTAVERAKYIQLAQAAGYEIIGYYFKSNVQEAVVRNMERIGKARVPDVGIFGTRKRLEIPSYAEGFNSLFYVQAVGAGTFNLRTWEENNKASS
ncbi:MAG: hypothetical protein ACO1OF_23080 [Adhaeribacter sp.]